MWRSYRNGSRRRHFLRRLLIFVLGLQAWQSTSLLADEWTNAQAITSIYMVQNVNVGGGTIIAQYFFYGAGAWGAPSCPTHTVAYTSSSSVGSKELLAAVLTAKTLAKTVKFYGVCQAGGYFVIFHAMIDP